MPIITTGDKPPSFLGSTQWIGSMEVGYYLDQELGLSWRSISASTGAELASKVRRKEMDACHLDWF